MNKAYLLTGGNIGDRTSYLQQAKELLELLCGTITSASHVYETDAWGNTGQAAFLNQALELQTELNAKQLLRRILKIEKLMGRERKEKYGPRNIDIDILLFNEEIYSITFLKIPHPELQNRRFALLPLSEIAPGYVHPVLKKTVLELLNVSSDKLNVRKWT